jgi:glutathione S-transferase
MPTHPATPIQFHTFALSGHSHRVELLLRMLELPYTSVPVDFANRAQKNADFLQISPFGQVPVIVDDGVVIWDSAAILVYLAEKYGDGRWLPVDPHGKSEVQRWLSVAAGAVVKGPMAARINLVFNVPCDMAQAHDVANTLFAVMDEYLQQRQYLAMNLLTIADLAMYAYIAHAPEGGIDLAPYPNLMRWLGNVEASRGFAPMPKSRTGLWANLEE